MVPILLVYILIVFALVGIAIYEHVTISTLSLPIPHALTILTILLPLLSPATAYFTPRLLQPASHSTTTTTTTNNNNNNPNNNPDRALTRKPPPSPSRNPAVLPIALNLALLTTTTALLTLLSLPLLSPATAQCRLAQQWHALFSAHDGPAIRAIQDALACCGFRSPRDMAWPFPAPGPPGRGPNEACERQFAGRTEGCLRRWEGEMRRGAGAGVGDFLQQTLRVTKRCP
ncbi:hypothetical protein BT67DRAFT_455091 [Trichocladium antarcticum]|uniref:Uncharacterized protein n=1 Tax=Trichocladium antarcticum TaxID=1450529 RepID=A0AAN6UNB4_9PEZI|nr:hypothetical protein BT67DRAFT_455091 [Trichocladium antarcticum]